MSPARAQTRERLLDAAVEVIAERGWAAATTRVVADRAGVNNALVHYHFGSVDELRRAAVMHATERELAGPITAMLESGDVLDGIVAAAAGLAQQGAGTPGQRVMTEALVQSLRDPALRADQADVLRSFRTALTARFAAARADRRLRADADPESMAVVFTALIDGLLLHAIADPGLDVAAHTEALTALLRPAEPAAAAEQGRPPSAAPGHRPPDERRP
jgi:AcrR family transcriptional regulator